MIMMTSDVELDRLAVLLPHFESRRLGVCPYCGCCAAWINASECGRHIFACAQITQGIETNASRARRAAKKAAVST